MTKSASQRPRILMIGLDSAAVSLIEQWTTDGSLPNLTALRRQGAFGRLESTAQINASPWPSFFTGTNPGDHGYHGFLMWEPERMRHKRPDGQWPEVTPFWREMSKQGPRVIALDVPDTFPGAPFNGLEVGNWAGHYRMCSFVLAPGRSNEANQTQVRR